MFRRWPTSLISLSSIALLNVRYQLRHTHFSGSSQQMWPIYCRNCAQIRIHLLSQDIPWTMEKFHLAPQSHGMIHIDGYPTTFIILSWSSTFQLLYFLRPASKPYATCLQAMVLAPVHICMLFKLFSLIPPNCIFPPLLNNHEQRFCAVSLSFFH